MSPKPKRSAALTAQSQNTARIDIPCEAPPHQTEFEFYPLTDGQKKTLLALRKVVKKMFDDQVAANPGISKMQ